MGGLRLKKIYLFDTHGLIFWSARESVSDAFIAFFDKEEQKGNLLVSSISFWEIALLVKKGKIAISDMHRWKDEILNYTNIKLVRPSVSEMINSTLLPDLHKDPFDRLLIAQARHREAILVTRDALIQQYDIPTFWL